MDFRGQKLRLALWILVVGMLIALIYHGYQGWVLGHGYPENTFVFYPEDRYGDFTNPYRFAWTETPYRYAAGGANYFPAAFLLFDAFAWLNPVPATILFLGLCSLGTFVVLEAALRRLVIHPGKRMLVAICLLWTYPFLLVMDRGNTEILMVLLISSFLFFYSRKKFGLSIAFLIPAICFKAYPAVLLLLFFRQRLFHWCFICVLGCAVLTWLALLTFPDPVLTSCHFLSQQLSTYNKAGVLTGLGVSMSASAWNAVRAAVWFVYHQIYQQPDYVGQLPSSVGSPTLEIYNLVCLIFLTFLSLFVLLVETSFARKSMLLLLFATVSMPGGADYKMMLVEIALVLLILNRERRPSDLVVVGLLAFCLLPKREIILHFMGPSDSGRFDAGISVILNPLCMLISIGLLTWCGWQRARPIHWTRKLRKFYSIFQFNGLRAYWARLSPLFHAKQKRRVVR